MLNDARLDTTLSKAQKTQALFAHAIKISHQVFIKRYNNNPLKNYKYDPSLAAKELGLDEDLVGQLVDDYISQIFNTKNQFYNIIENIKKLKDADKEAKRIDLKNLAHKNLGVAKNLRIEDAQVFLNDLMTTDDVKHLKDCVDALEACAFKLNPTHAFNLIQVMELKSSF